MKYVAPIFLALVTVGILLVVALVGFNALTQPAAKPTAPVSSTP